MAIFMSVYICACVPASIFIHMTDAQPSDPKIGPVIQKMIGKFGGGMGGGMGGMPGMG